ncbi:hypothetical protein PC9H_002700 [Pleurotus ostreatus]|uniref:Uncharacterized protein n=1 Tax=Pleurotus ostreatus TaxID=5322 RepID=A0A8H6ZJG8_PLEOS|nr:uncharacterized protein PC9H_002700 [Pleurotus ostreatus]KAF7416434.1 hypothetical protein PC9H_002700 [Pleurotus ostreatus]
MNWTHHFHNYHRIRNATPPTANKTWLPLEKSPLSAQPLIASAITSPRRHHGAPAPALQHTGTWNSGTKKPAAERAEPASDNMNARCVSDDLVYHQDVDVERLSVLHHCESVDGEVDNEGVEPEEGKEYWGGSGNELFFALISSSGLHRSYILDSSFYYSTQYPRLPYHAIPATIH